MDLKALFNRQMDKAPQFIEKLAVQLGFAKPTTRSPIISPLGAVILGAIPLYAIYKIVNRPVPRDRQFNLEVVKAGSSGTKRPIVFIHGGFHAAWCWEPLMEYFSKLGHPCYAISWRGHGNSEGKDVLSQLSLIDCCDDVFKTIARLHLKELPIFIGHSAGGGVSQKFAEMYPDFLAGLITIAAFPPSGGFWGFFNWFSLMPLTYFKVILTGNNFYLLETPKDLKRMMFSDNFDDDKVKRYHDRLERKESPIMPMDLTFRFVDPKRIKVPVLVIGGKSDRIFTPELVQKAAKEYGQEAVLIDGAHNVMLDDHWTDVADCIKNWISSKF